MISLQPVCRCCMGKEMVTSSTPAPHQKPLHCIWMFLSDPFLLLSPFQMMGFTGRPTLTDSTSTSETKPLSAQLPTGWTRWSLKWVGWWPLGTFPYLPDVATGISPEPVQQSEFWIPVHFSNPDQQRDCKDHAAGEWDHHPLECPLHPAPVFQRGEFPVLRLLFWQT